MIAKALQIEFVYTSPDSLVTPHKLWLSFLIPKTRRGRETGEAETPELITTFHIDQVLIMTKKRTAIFFTHLSTHFCLIPITSL
jgi:hypothetical protein